MVITARRSRFVPFQTAVVSAALIQRAPLETRVAFIEAMEELGDEVWAHPIFIQAINAETVDLWDSLQKSMRPFRVFGPN